MSHDKEISAQDHYTQFPMQPIEFLLANAEHLTFLQANVIKYVCRYKRKGGLRDLEKAKQYLEWMIEDLLNKTDDKVFDAATKDYLDKMKAAAMKVSG